MNSTIQQLRNRVWVNCLRSAIAGFKETGKIPQDHREVVKDYRDFFGLALRWSQCSKSDDYCPLGMEFDAAWDSYTLILRFAIRHNPSRLFGGIQVVAELEAWIAERHREMVDLCNENPDVNLDKVIEFFDVFDGTVTMRPRVTMPHLRLEDTRCHLIPVTT